MSNFGEIYSRNPRVHAVNNNTLCGDTAKISISHQISPECPEPILTYFTGLLVVLAGMVIPIFVWQSPKGRCYGNQLNLRSVRLHHQEQPLFIASVLNNGSDDRKSSFKRLTRGPHYGAEWAIC